MQIPAIPLVVGGRIWAVPSRSEPNTWNIVNLAKGTCSGKCCQFNPQSEKLCYPMQQALAGEKLLRDLQGKMPMQTAREMTAATGQKHLPRVPEIPDQELRAIFR